MTKTDPSMGATSDTAQSSISKELASLESAARELLHTAGVYDIGSYGWLNENDVDPDFVGHAMWQLDQPLARPLDDLLTSGRCLSDRHPEISKSWWRARTSAA